MHGGQVVPIQPQQPRQQEIWPPLQPPQIQIPPNQFGITPIQPEPETPQPPIMIKGDKGDPGVSMVGLQILDDGTGLVEYSDGRQVNIGMMRGKDGRDGLDAPPLPVTSHFVLVVDPKASYWARMQQQLERAQEAYSKIKVTTPPDRPVGALPALVLYQLGTPIRDWRGSREVSDALNRIGRNEMSQLLET